MQLINTTTFGDGTTLAHIEVSATCAGRKWGIFRVARVVRLAKGVTNKNSRTPGAEVLTSAEFDARSAKQTAAATAKVHAACRAALV